MYDRNILKEMREVISLSQSILNNNHVLVGFDGYIDKLVRLKKNQNKPAEYFTTISQFSSFISLHSDQSCDIEVDCISEKIGGNGPLLADALAVKGANVTCIGACGYPYLCKNFEMFAEQSKVISIEQPANTFAMEFSNGKLMFGDSNSLSNIDFALICDRVGLSRLQCLIDNSDLFCFTNWSGILHSNDILEGILSDICPFLIQKDRMIFFDLADPSPKSPEQFHQFFKLLKKLQQFFWVIIGLNPKECLMVYNQFYNKEKTDYSPEMLEELRIDFPVDEIAFHGIDYSCAGTRTIPMQEISGKRVENPKVVTGGGDNFNSGYCAGKLMGLSPSQCACLGNLSSMLYVAEGVSPDMLHVLELIDNIIN